MRNAADTPTPGSALGPFYPVQPRQDADHRLWREDAAPAGARLLRFGGRVKTMAQEPLVGALVEVWQADPAGRYPHPAATECELVHPAFVGYGQVRTGADGRFAFESLVPGGYTAGRSLRARHLHVQITSRLQRLLTQVFLPGDAACATDRWFSLAPRPEMLVARVVSDDACVLQLDWDAVFARG